jgi:hypothetical protein
VGCAYPPGEWRRGEREVGRDLGKILCMHGSGFPLLLSFLENFESRLGWGGSSDNAGHLAWHRLLDFSGKGFAPKRKEKERNTHIK